MTVKDKVYIILVNYNGWKDTIECLESVLKSDYPNYQIIVVDNNSPNNSMEYIKAWAEGRQEVVYDKNSQLKHLSQPNEPKPLDYVFYNKEQALKGGIPEKETSLDNPLIFIQAGDNRGFAAGNNIGIRYALAKDDFEYIWLLNNDTVVEKNTLSKACMRLQNADNQKSKIGIVGSKLLFYDNPDIIQGIGGLYNKKLSTAKHLGAYEKDSGQYDTDKVLDKIDYVIGASMFVTKNFILDIGLMCEDFFLYFEEIDWTLRGQSKGYAIDYCWESKVYHKEGSSILQGSKFKKGSEISDYYGHRNRLIITKEHFPENLWLVKLSFLGAFFKRIKRRQFSRIKIIYKAYRDGVK